MIGLRKYAVRYPSGFEPALAAVVPLTEKQSPKDIAYRAFRLVSYFEEAIVDNGSALLGETDFHIREDGSNFLGKEWINCFGKRM